MDGWMDAQGERGARGQAAAVVARDGRVAADAIETAEGALGVTGVEVGRVARQKRRCDWEDCSGGSGGGQVSHLWCDIQRGLVAASLHRNALCDAVKIIAVHTAPACDLESACILGPYAMHPPRLVV